MAVAVAMIVGSCCNFSMLVRTMIMMMMMMALPLFLLLLLPISISIIIVALEPHAARLAASALGFLSRSWALTS